MELYLICVIVGFDKTEAVPVGTKVTVQHQ